MTTKPSGATAARCLFALIMLWIGVYVGAHGAVPAWMECLR
jgi:hypothetical protein